MALNSGLKAKESQESWESLFRRTLSKERMFTFTRPADNPIHWIQLLDPFDQQDSRRVCKSTVTQGGDLAGDVAAKVPAESRAAGSMDVPGWPLVPFSKVRTFKCEKCCLEFCSPMNHRRHLRMVHRRPLQAEKEDLKSLRQQFSTFWDKLSPEEAYKIAAMKSLQLEGLTGEKVARALSQLLQQPSLFALPHSYVKAGVMLLEIVQSRSPRVHLTASELFRILDGSSEKTFPAFGLNAMQRYVFEGEAGKVGLEAKNLVASLGFLVENNLVKAFIKHKDEEAMRCQTALVEEEEASQRRQAQIQARKRMRKVRQKDKEQKASDLATRLLSNSDASDDEILQSRPSSNTFENLNHNLAEEGSDYVHLLEVVSSAVSSPLEESPMPRDGDDNISVGDNVDKILEGEFKDSSNRSATNECSPHDASGGGKVVDAGPPSDGLGVQNLCNHQKRKYPVEHSLSFREAPVIPYQKHSWKERRSMSARNLGKQSPANEHWEDLGLSNSHFPRSLVRDSSSNQVAGFRHRQYVAKPVRFLNTQSVAAPTGAAVWTKKTLKSADAALAKLPHLSEVATASIPDVSEQANASSESSVGISTSATPDDNKGGTPAVSSTMVCPSIELPLSPAWCNDQVNVASSEAGFCVLESSASALSAAGLDQSDEPCYEGPNPAVIAPVVVGSVVIGSVSVPLESIAGHNESVLMARACKDSRPVRQLSDVSERELVKAAKDSCRVNRAIDGSDRDLPKLVDSADNLNECNGVSLTTGENAEEGNGVLHENGVIKHATLKEPKGERKPWKVLSSSDAERKENKEHSSCQNGVCFSPKLTGVQGGSFTGTRAKVWRPVVSNASHDHSIQKVSGSAVNSPDGTTVPSKENGAVGGGITNVGSMEFGPSPELKALDENDINPASGCASTLAAIARFLSQRWSDALESADTVILSVDDEEGCATQGSDMSVEDQDKGSNVHSKDATYPSPQLNKEAKTLPGNARKIHGLWKQGCSGSAMVVNRQLNGKDNLHFAPRFSGYRYVPK